MSKNTFLKIIFPGLNQIYMTSSNILDYEMLYIHFVENLTDIIHDYYPELTKIEIKDNILNEFQNIIKMQQETLNTNFDEIEKLIINAVDIIIKNDSHKETKINSNTLKYPILYNEPIILFFVKEVNRYFNIF